MWRNSEISLQADCKITLSSRNFKLFYFVFFLSGFSFTDTGDSQDSSGTEGTIFFPTLSPPPAHEYLNIYLKLYMWDDIFNRTACMYQTATRWDLQSYRITIWLIDDVKLVFICLLDDLILGFCCNNLDTGNRWTQTRMDYHPCFTSEATNQVC